MKKFLFASIFAMLFSCSSSSDDSAEQINPSTYNFIGDWKLVAKRDHTGAVIPISDCEDNYSWYRFIHDNGATVGGPRTWQNGGNFFCEQSTITGVYTTSHDTLTYTWQLSGYKTRYKIVSANSLTIELKMLDYESATGINVIANNQRKTEICNKVE